MASGDIWQDSGDIAVNIPEDNEKIDDRTSLLPGESGGATAGITEQFQTKSGLFSFDFYQSLFDVDTDTVCTRLRSAIIPKKNYNFIESVLRARRRAGPDMYGPFWICTTLVFSTAICGNLANFIANTGDPSYEYSPEFEKVSLVASSVFGYAYFFPVILYFLIKYKVSNTNNNANDYRFLEILCTYGYSLFVYIPISILWVFPFESFRWLLVLVGAGISCSMLTQAFYPVVKSEKKQLIYILLGLVCLSNLALAIGFKIYFFEAKMMRISDASLQHAMQDSDMNVKAEPLTEKPLSLETRAQFVAEEQPQVPVAAAVQSAVEQQVSEIAESAGLNDASQVVSENSEAISENQVSNDSEEAVAGESNQEPANNS